MITVINKTLICHEMTNELKVIEGHKRLLLCLVFYVLYWISFKLIYTLRSPAKSYTILVLVLYYTILNCRYKNHYLLYLLSPIAEIFNDL